MKKDGTRYLINYLLREKMKYDIVHWGIFAMNDRGEGWCNQVGLGLKIDLILSFIELDSVIYNTNWKCCNS